MQKVVSINLNGNAFQLEEPGYEALRAYLERADRGLQANPDRAEIMADLEQAIAEKCGRYLGATKTVVTAAEVDTIIAEMGPVESPEAGAGTAGTGGTEANMSSGASASTGKAEEGRDPRRRLYQIREGAMISGVCNGLAAFLDVDVTIVRLLFVIITFATFGAWILAYLLMAMFIPYADTPEDRAAAYGFNLKAGELLGHNLHRAREHAFRQWRRSFRRQRRQQRSWQKNFSQKWHQQWEQHMAQQPQATMTGAPPVAPYAHALVGPTLPLLSILNAALFVAWILIMASAFLTDSIFGWPLPDGIPQWVSLVILFVLYFAITGPLRAARHMHLAYTNYYSAWAPLATVLGILATVLFFWLAYEHIPQVHELIDQLPALWEKRRHLPLNI